MRSAQLGDSEVCTACGVYLGFALIFWSFLVSFGPFHQGETGNNSGHVGWSVALQVAGFIAPDLFRYKRMQAVGAHDCGNNEGYFLVCFIDTYAMSLIRF